MSDGDSLVSVLTAFLDEALPKKSGTATRSSIAVAVSGGGDSMALLAAAIGYCKENNTSLHAVTVNHHLREESQEEIALVKTFCASHKIPHKTLSWEGWDKQGNLQARARDARRDLIGAWAREAKISAVLMAHSFDDVVETFILRLARGSGVDGLAMMRDRFTHNRVLWLRPFLSVSRESLRDSLRAQHITWAEDASNTDDNFERVRVRKALPEFTKLGIDPLRLYQTAQDLTSARRALEHHTDQLARALIRVQKSGSLHVDWRRLRAEPQDYQRRILTLCLHFIAGAGYPPRATAMASLFEQIKDKKRTALAGCIISFSGEDVLEISREPKAMPICVAHGKTMTYDGNWKIKLANFPKDSEIKPLVKPLGEAGLKACKNWRDSGLTRQALAATPALWQGDVLLATPFLALSNPPKSPPVFTCHFTKKQKAVNAPPTAD